MRWILRGLLWGVLAFGFAPHRHHAAVRRSHGAQYSRIPDVEETRRLLLAQKAAAVLQEDYMRAAALKAELEKLDRMATLMDLQRRHSKRQPEQQQPTTPEFEETSRTSSAGGDRRLQQAAAQAAVEAVGPGAMQERKVPSRWKKLVAFSQNYTCCECGCVLPPDYEIDHVVPLGLGGSNGMANLQALCRPCHVQKTRDQRHAILDATTTATHSPTRSPSLVDGSVEAGTGVAQANPAAVDRKAAGKKGAKSGKTKATRPVIDLEPPKQRGGANNAISSNETQSRGDFFSELVRLNPQQREAVCADAPALRVVAGPGTGKTRVLTMRIANLVLNHGCPPGAILALTFTNRAADEMRSRAQDLLGPATAESVGMGTFHRLCLSILRADIELIPYSKSDDRRRYRRGFAIYDQTAMVKAAGQIISELGWDKKEVKPASVQSEISFLKNKQIDAATYGRMEGHDPILALVFHRYEEVLRRRNVVDFDDMLLLTVKLLRATNKYVGRWQHVLVDEFQDTNGPQYEILKLLSREPEGPEGPRAACSLFVVGDSDQAIYGWRGADYRNQERFDRDFSVTARKEEPADSSRGSTPPSTLQPQSRLVTEPPAVVGAGLGKEPAVEAQVVALDALRALDLGVLPIQTPTTASPMNDSGPSHDREDEEDLDLETDVSAGTGASRISKTTGGGALRWGTRLKLEINYRSSQEILDAATALVEAPNVRFRMSGHKPPRRRDSLRLVSHRLLRQSTPNNASQTPLPEPQAMRPMVVEIPDADSEAKWVAAVAARLRTAQGAGSIGILYRTNAQSRSLERELMREGVPHTLVHATRFFDRREVRDALAYLQIIADPNDDQALERIINVPPRAIGKKTISQIQDFASRQNKTLWEAVSSVAEGGGSGQEACKLAPRAAAAVSKFHSLIATLQEKARDTAGLHSTFCRLLWDPIQAGARPPEQDPANARKEPQNRGTQTTTEDAPRVDLESSAMIKGSLRGLASAGPGSVPWLLLETLALSGYEDWLRSEDPTGDERWRNLRELANMATGHSTEDTQLRSFLDRVALIQDQDMMGREAIASVEAAEVASRSRAGQGEQEGSAERTRSPDVKLMTIHASKGLEFDTVFVVGCEEDCIPHYLSTRRPSEGGEVLISDALSQAEESEGVDEERRLLYVAMTRARKHLFLCHTRRRVVWGLHRDAQPSRFLADIPPDQMQSFNCVDSPSSPRQASGSWTGRRRRSD